MFAKRAFLVAAAVLISIPLVGTSSASASTPVSKITGWFGNWASDSQIESYLDKTREAKANRSADINRPAIFWWKFDGIRNPICTFTGGGDTCSTSGPTPWTTPKLDGLRKKLQGSNQFVYATYTDLDSSKSGQLARLLRDPQKRNILAKRLTAWAKKAQVDGVDLDLENFAFHDGRKTWKSTSKNLTRFLENLDRRLGNNGMKLSLTVPAGVRTFNGSSPVNSTGYWVYDWAKNIQYVDQLRVMTYDYSWNIPGPIGPNWWAADVARSARQQVGRDSRKVFLGVPLYGRNWVVYQDGALVLSQGCPSGWKPDTAPFRSTLTATQAEAIAVREGVKPSWDPFAAEWNFDYFWKIPGTNGVTCGVKRTIWWGAGDSVQARAAVARGNRLGGVAVWELSQLSATSLMNTGAFTKF